MLNCSNIMIRRAANGFIVSPINSNYERMSPDQDDFYVFPTAAALGVWMKSWGDALEAQTTGENEDGRNP